MASRGCSTSTWAVPGIGKTIEAGLIAAELLACGDAQRLAVLCSPQLAPQWQSELRTKFGINAEVLLPSTANRLTHSVPFGSTVYEHYPYLIVSTDYVKQRSRRDEFALLCPELVIVDEAHSCIAPSSAIGSSQAHQRYLLLRRLADDQTRHLVLAGVGSVFAGTHSVLVTLIATIAAIVIVAMMLAIRR